VISDYFSSRFINIKKMISFNESMSKNNILYFRFLNMRYYILYKIPFVFFCVFFLIITFFVSSSHNHRKTVSLFSIEKCKHIMNNLPTFLLYNQVKTDVYVRIVVIPMDNSSIVLNKIQSNLFFLIHHLVK
jgi:hypothetical protein